MDHSTGFIKTTNLSQSIIPRQGLSSFSFCNKIYIMFGYGGVNKTVEDLDDLFELDEQLLNIKRIETKGFKPSPRTGQTVVKFQDKVYCYGGYSGPKRMNDLFELDLKNMEWKFHSNYGIGISHHSCVLYSEKLFIFGGLTDQGIPINELKTWNIIHKNWETILPIGDVPSPRSHHSACVFNEEIYLFGGYSSPFRFNDIYSLNMNNGIWKKIQVNGKRTRRLSEHSANIINYSMIVYGGFNGKKVFNDLLEFDLISKRWKKKKIEDEKRYLHSSLILNDNLYLMFGFDGMNLIGNICKVLLCEGMNFRKKMMNNTNYYDIEIKTF